MTVTSKFLAEAIKMQAVFVQRFQEFRKDNFHISD
jgi:hypothetical protein